MLEQSALVLRYSRCPWTSQFELFCTTFCSYVTHERKCWLLLHSSSEYSSFCCKCGDIVSIHIDWGRRVARCLCWRRLTIDTYQNHFRRFATTERAIPHEDYGSNSWSRNWVAVPTISSRPAWIRVYPIDGLRAPLPLPHKITINLIITSRLSSICSG